MNPGPQTWQQIPLLLCHLTSPLLSFFIPIVQKRTPRPRCGQMWWGSDLVTELLELKTEVLEVVYFSRSCHHASLVPCLPPFLWALTPRAPTAMCSASFLHHRHFHLFPACSRPLHSRLLHPRCPVTVFSTSPISPKFPVGRAGPPYITTPYAPPCWDY